LTAPGGFRICAETSAGSVRYVALHSQFGGLCRIANPWGAGVSARVRSGHTTLQESAESVLLVPTERNRTYTIETAELPLFGTVRVQRTGRRSVAPRRLNDRLLGSEAA
jgi:hypothetical protein